ncbi:uncharacterized protein LOC124898484 [Capsicum annuum]|uniref:uncharacterized protein LOC124898484 n=1 Tax=Capsicum annuum TaxID=4072 RepID=UPI001FB19D2B|nr:uncharacterized protein LOC124898484 [Capsicum annuum]
MPLAVYKKFGLGDPKPTNMQLVMADRSVKEVNFNFDDDFLKAFEFLKGKLFDAPIIVTSNWSKPFEIMCDASGVALGDVLGKMRDKLFNPIYYASKLLNEAQKNYTVTEQELLTVVYAFEKFQAYLLGTKNEAVQLRLGQLNEMDEFRLRAYKRDDPYKEMMKKYHDWSITKKRFSEGLLGASLQLQTKTVPNTDIAEREDFYSQMFESADRQQPEGLSDEPSPLS